MELFSNFGQSILRRVALKEDEHHEYFDLPGMQRGLVQSESFHAGYKASSLRAVILLLCLYSSGWQAVKLNVLQMHIDLYLVNPIINSFP